MLSALPPSRDCEPVQDGAGDDRSGRTAEATASPAWAIAYGVKQTAAQVPERRIGVYPAMEAVCGTPAQSCGARLPGPADVAQPLATGALPAARQGDANAFA